MKNLTRRQFGKVVSSGVAVLSISSRVASQEKPKVVIVGGGAGGATAARYLVMNSKGAIDVTLIENSRQYTSCFFSNLYLGDVRGFDSITHSYKTLAREYGINVVHGLATEVDRSAKTVNLSDGTAFTYDRLVLSPGIEILYDSVPGYSESAARVAPHAWQGGLQLKLLKDKLDALQNGDNVVMVAPPDPYRCPPGPYERASMIAHLFKTKGMTDSTITILDYKNTFSKQGLFTPAWELGYPGTIEWLGPDIHGGIIEVNADKGTVETDFDTFAGALLNIIPKQQAGFIASKAGLTDDTGYCQIDSDSMRSVVDESIFVIGDASIAGAMPKSGFSANSQAKVAVLHILADVMHGSTPPARYTNTCWSLIDTDNAVKVGAQYASLDGNISSTSSFISQVNEDAATRKSTYEESLSWYAGISKVYMLLRGAAARHG